MVKFDLSSRSDLLNPLVSVGLLGCVLGPYGLGPKEVDPICGFPWVGSNLRAFYGSDLWIFDGI